jgi:hypothetical protein
MSSHIPPGGEPPEPGPFAGIPLSASATRNCSVCISRPSSSARFSVPNGHLRLRLTARKAAEGGALGLPGRHSDHRRPRWQMASPRFSTKAS